MAAGSDFFSQSGEQQSGQTSGTSTVNPGNVASSVNNLYLGSLQGLAGAYPGGLSYFAQGFPNLYQPGGQEQGILNQIMGLSGQSRYTPEMSQGIGSIKGLLGAGAGAGNYTNIGPERYQDNSGNIFTQSQLQDMIPGRDINSFMSTGSQPQEYTQALQTIQQLLASAMQGPSTLEQGGLNTLQGRTDPSALTSAAEQYMRLIGEPSARAASVAGGMGGVKGGAFGEGLARESGRMALPIAQMIQQAQGEFGNAQLGVGGNLEARRSGLAGGLFNMRGAMDQRTQQLAQMLYGMGMGDSRQNQLGLLSAGQGAAQVGRLGGIQDFLRQQGLMAGLLGVPLSGAGTTTQTGTSVGSKSSPFTLGSLLGPLSSISAAALLADPKTLDKLGGGLGSVFSGVGSAASGVGKGISDIFSRFGIGGSTAPTEGATGISDTLRSILDSSGDTNWSDFASLY